MKSKRASIAFDSAALRSGSIDEPMSRLFSRENLIALALCLIVIAVIIATTSSAPQWIYQGF